MLGVEAQFQIETLHLIEAFRIARFGMKSKPPCLPRSVKNEENLTKLEEPFLTNLNNPLGVGQQTLAFSRHFPFIASCTASLTPLK